ncbi:hypothetical protein SAMN05216386_0513 [Nitrosospira briensis]|uniref:Uncharacterized protein n=1 Tax=Nitrosospira briensis TaxID=35799 RepID=A0A1I4Y4W1_9PROT|nr:hypothetical protein SAMN05216386_0513 [Nitrosospira briensis]
MKVTEELHFCTVQLSINDVLELRLIQHPKIIDVSAPRSGTSPNRRPQQINEKMFFTFGSCRYIYNL